MSRNSHAVVRVITNLAHHVTVAVIGTNFKALLSSLSNRNVHEEHAQREQDSHRAGYDTGNREALTRASLLGLLQGQGAQNNRSDTQQGTNTRKPVSTAAIPRIIAASAMPGAFFVTGAAYG